MGSIGIMILSTLNLRHNGKGGKGLYFNTPPPLKIKTGKFHFLRGGGGVGCRLLGTGMYDFRYKI